MLTSSAPFPRWLEARAARLSAALLESVLEVHGHARLLERLCDVRFGRALAAALGLPDENDLGAVARLLQSGLKNDERRLGLVIDPAAGVVSLEDGSLTPLFCIDGERVIRLRQRRALVDVDRRLGAALLVAHGQRPFPFLPVGKPPGGRALGSRAPGRGPRELFALAVLSDLIVADEVPPELTRLALGSARGAPFAVPLLIYDGVLRALEGLLHGAPVRTGARAAARSREFRLWPLLALHDDLRRQELSRQQRSGAAGQPLESFVRREKRFAKDLDSRALDDGAKAASATRPLPRRPVRKTRRALSWQPPALRPTRGLGQRDLFAP